MSTVVGHIVWLSLAFYYKSMTDAWRELVMMKKGLAGRKIVFGNVVAIH
jgi:hypothetical protein